MKKALILSVTAVMAFSLVGCSSIFPVNTVETSTPKEKRESFTPDKRRRCCGRGENRDDGCGGKPLSPEKKAEAVMLAYALLTNPAVRRDSVVALLTKVV